MYNRTELKSMLSEKETWVIIGGGSNSYGMGATVMKAVHNDDGASPSPNDGNNGFTYSDSIKYNQWRKNCVVDTIKHRDGSTTVRAITMADCPGVLGSTMGGRLPVWSADTVAKLTAYFEETEALFTPGSIRVTHVGVFYFNHFQQLLEIASRPNVPWPRLLAYSHSIQRYSSAADIHTDLTGLVTEEVCARKGNLCFIGSRLPYNTVMRQKQLEVLSPSPGFHFLDFAQLGLNNFETCLT
jgi:hypothetical protein